MAKQKNGNGTNGVNVKMHYFLGLDKLVSVDQFDIKKDILKNKRLILIFCLKLNNPELVQMKLLLSQSQVYIWKIFKCSSFLLIKDIRIYMR